MGTDRYEGLMAEAMDEIESIGERPAPRPRAMERPAAAYLDDLGTAADMMLQRRDEATLAEQGKWTMIPAGVWAGRKDHPGDTYISPLQHMDRRRHERLRRAVQEARLDVAEIAWWYCTAALTALEGVLAEQKITAQNLQLATLKRPGRHEEIDGVTDPVDPVFRPELPQPGCLHTGNPGLDEAMETARSAFQDAYQAADVAEELYARDRLEDWEAADMHAAAAHSDQIPDLLITYARPLVQAAHAAPMQVTG